ncbi:MAG: tRNA (guanosine(37)-N1)-methyltransferase TrmD [Nocardioidaceae bacterium]|nr:tRNA (guanosine(37)-N1)-methyltransferase TrmD [Nocardioidaceae bacterium]
MRVDVVTIFPEYLEPLSLSLVGRARSRGLLDLTVHDLRDHTHDRHRTTDDTPYGGGAGMVMRPEPWGEALDALVPDGTERAPVLVVPTPAGRPFTQADAERLSAEPWLVFACGRYEGIDQRVLDHAATSMRVEEVSIGDVVLNGGEVAVMAVVEATVRLLPGVLGNPESLTEESHGPSGLLEYPVYTKPAAWRGHDVPDVLLSGDHGRIAAWRGQQSLARTAARRPDLIADAMVAPVVPLADADVPELYVLQRCCWVQEAQANPGITIPALVESIDDARAALGRWTTWGVRASGRLVGAVRGQADDDLWHVGRLMVAPDQQGRGLGRRLLRHAEAEAPPGTSAVALVTGARSEDNLRMYRRAGYEVVEVDEAEGVAHLLKRL